MQTRTIKTFKPFLLAVILVMFGAQAFAKPQASPTKPADLPSAIEAKRILAQLVSARIEKIRSASVREDMQRAASALKAVGGNTSRSREATLLAAVHRAALKIKADAQTQTAEINFNACDHQLETCHLMETPPELCKLADDGCVFMTILNSLVPHGAPLP